LVQVDTFSSFEVNPPAHGAQMRSTIALAALAMYVLGLQVPHGLHTLAFFSTENCPLGQPLQVLSEDGSGTMSTDVPGSQSVQATQLVAGLLSLS